MESEQQIKQFYNFAVKHQKEHKCGAHVYESGEKLISYLLQNRPNNILEIGTGVGYTSALMAVCLPDSKIITLEKDSEHAAIAQELFKSNELNSVELVEEVAESYLPKITKQFDFIFFDGYQIHYEFLPHYERLLKPGGILFLGNNHLQSKTSSKFFEEIIHNGKWKILEKFDETLVAAKLK